MFGIVYVVDGQGNAVNEEFKSMEQAKSFAENEGFSNFTVIPLHGKIDFSNAIIDIGLC